MMPNFMCDSDRKPEPCTKPETLEQRVACLAEAGPQAITNRLAELDSEWTAGRMTKAAIGGLIVVGFTLTALLGPWWLIMPAIGGVLLLEYWFRRTSWLGKTFHEIGYRTGGEVHQEMTALKVLRGDFRHLPTLLDIENREDISRLEGEGGIAVDPDESKTDSAVAAHAAVQAAKH